MAALAGVLLVVASSGFGGTAKGEDAAHGPYALSVFGGPGSELALSDTLLELPDFQDSGARFVGVAVSRELVRFDEALGLEAELMAAYHFGNEHYGEVGIALYARWHAFPWNRWVSTTAAVGMGPSYTTIYPEIEHEPGDDERSRVLNQFNLELTFAPPDRPGTSLLLRLQHRSGVFGLVDEGNSDFLTIGLRQVF
jgi:hypothetical protein